MQDHGPGQPRWRIALWTLLVEAVCLATVLALPGFLLLLGSSGCMSPGVSDQTEPQMSALPAPARPGSDETS